MDEFVSTYTNKVDAKGRGYRSRRSIAPCWRWTASDGIYCCPTLDRQAVDVGGNRFREAIQGSLANFEPFSEDHEFLSTTLIGESEILKLDSEGRVVLTESIRTMPASASGSPSSARATSSRSGSPSASPSIGTRPRTGCATSGAPSAPVRRAAPGGAQ